MHNDGLNGLLKSIASAIVKIRHAINEANLSNSNNFTSIVNCHGQSVNRLDIVANDILSNCIENSGSCAGIVSEEIESFQSFDCKGHGARYICAFDPLDGSSNILVNGCLGTIFSIYRQPSFPGELIVSDFLQAGCQQVAAGYAMYGASTVFVYSTRTEVNGFTLDEHDDQFYLTYPKLQIEQTGTHYAFNSSRSLSFPLSVRRYLKDRELIFAERTDVTYRYQGCMVADMHRILTQGGIFLHPSSKEHPRGKLRLMYECNPLAFITEVAGGAATNGKERLLNITPEFAHQCSPIFIGSYEMVKEFDRYQHIDRLNQ
jgi:fructose-1,6-bisphosphatase I